MYLILDGNVGEVIVMAYLNPIAKLTRLRYTIFIRIVNTRFRKMLFNFRIHNNCFVGCVE